LETLPQDVEIGGEVGAPGGLREEDIVFQFQRLQRIVPLHVGRVGPAAIQTDEVKNGMKSDVPEVGFLPDFVIPFGAGRNPVGGNDDPVRPVVIVGPVVIRRQVKYEVFVQSRRVREKAFDEIGREQGVAVREVVLQVFIEWPLELHSGPLQEFTDVMEKCGQRDGFTVGPVHVAHGEPPPRNSTIIA
jgi:hypothetical protein